jgi:transcriptional regulator with XRE-family HTH domain
VAVIPERTNALAELMIARGISQQDLSAFSGVSRQTVANAYHGRDRHRVSLETWVRLANALGVPVATIAPPAEAARIVAVA